MTDILIYIIKSSVSLAILYLTYFFLFRKERFFEFNRFFLLAALICSIFLPLIQLNIPLPVFQRVQSTFLIFPGSALLPDSQNLTPAGTSGSQVSWSSILAGLYFLGAIFYGLRFLINLIHLYLNVRKNPVIRFDDYKLVLLNSNTVPHTFLNYIFINSKEYHNNSYPSLIIEHEIAHIRQKHTLDRLIVELIQVAFWFNPIIILYKRSLKTIHEYLADHTVLGICPDIRQYKEALLEHTYSIKPLILSSHSTYSLIKKRLMMMNANKSMQYSKFRIAALIPVVALLIAGLNFKASAEPEINSQEGKLIEGSVRDVNTNQPMPSVSVIIQGKPIGTITDFAGNYAIMIADDEDKILVFVREGYNTAFMPVSTSGRIDVLMEKMDDKNQPMNQALRGDDNNPGKISIRSADGRHPLYIVDEKRISEDQMGNIKPDDIHSVSVFKSDRPEIGNKYAGIIEKYPEEAESGIVVITLKK